VLSIRRGSLQEITRGIDWNLVCEAKKDRIIVFVYYYDDLLNIAVNG
jgi:hypothetical protein